MRYVGIDPGKGKTSPGGIAVIDGHVAEAWVMPDNPEELWEILSNAIDSETTVVLEKVWARGGNGSKAIWSLAENIGWIEMALSLLKPREIIQVAPQRWQRDTFKELYGTDSKSVSLDMARSLFPEVNLKLKKHHGKSDALHLAYWPTLKM